MKKTYLIALSLLSANLVFAQRSKIIYAELGGNAITYSLNMDTRFAKTNDGVGVRVGACFFRKDALVFPVQLNYVIGKKDHGLELGAGIYPLISLIKSTENVYAPSAAVVYRYQPTDKHFSLRVGWTPTFYKTENQSHGFDLSSVFRLWPGLSFGYKF
jgi:hypothetical protein